MSLIRKSNELVIPTTVKMMIYGQAGMGKSTVALSAPKPLLLDFDNGVKRMNMAHLENIDTVQVASWSDVQQVLQEDLSVYQTIVVDTIGKMMDFIITHKCGSRQPSIRDWSGINAEFSWMTRTLSSLNKHTIFVAHRDSRKEGDDTVFIPSLREKSYNSIVTELDLLGYLEMKSERGVQRRTITFDPTSRNDGKNTCNLPSVMEVPTILDRNGNPTAKNDFISSKVINPYLSMLAVKDVERKKYDKVIEEIKESIEFITDAQSANDFASHINDFEHVGSSLMKARSPRSRLWDWFITVKLKRTAMQMQQPKYRFYATILDAFWGYLNSDTVWEKYWSWSENPPHTPEEFHELQYQELIDRINRKPFDNEKADRGTVFNEVIDCMVEHRKSEMMQIEKVYKVQRIGACDETGKPLYYDEITTNTVIALKATYNNREFTFPISLCREFADYFKGALTQQRVEAILPTAFGDVLVYGLIDELMPTSVHDIKTTGSYTVGKFKDHHQHLVYPYALMKNGSDVRTFEYNIVEFNKGGYVVDTYTETYVFKPERDIPILTNHCEEFIRFLEENRDLITDTKIFGGEN